jgi:RHS repeat-associated protein
VSRVHYLPYGSLIETTGAESLPTDRLFTGQRLENIGLYDYRARFYDPLVGSFIQPDSIVPDPLDPRAWNRLGYVYGNPVNFTDPSGHCPWCFLSDVADVGFFAASVNDYSNDPTWANAGWLALDVVGLLPIVPSLGAVRHAGKLALTDEAVDVARRVDDVGLGDEIIYYHTTSIRGAENIRLNGVDPFYGRVDVDFGQGFYVTPNRAQAQDWLARKFKGEGTILEFRVSKSELESFKGKVFEKPNKDWQDFVTAHRTSGTPIHSYDFVEGPVAINRSGVWVPHQDPTYWQLSVHTKAAAEIFTKGLLP